MNKASELLHEISQPLDEVRRDELANELLHELHRGFPVESLRILLMSNHVDAVRSGIWIASELGVRNRPLLDDVSRLLKHPDRYVRFFAIDSILSGSTAKHERIVAGVVRLLGDPDEAVRSKSTDFLSRAREEQLRAALLWFAKADPRSEHRTGLEWLLGCDAENAGAITMLLQNDSPTLRKYAVAAATRKWKADSGPLTSACGCEDEDIKKFATLSIRLFEREKETAR